MTDPEATLPPKPRNLIAKVVAWGEAHPMTVLLVASHVAAFVLGAWAF